MRMSEDQWRRRNEQKNQVQAAVEKGRQRIESEKKYDESHVSSEFLIISNEDRILH